MASVLIDIHNPSKRNVRDATGVCFTRSTFLISPSRPRLPDDDHAAVASSSSPKKKHKIDVEIRWQAAVDAMNEDKNEKEDVDDNVFGTSPVKPEDNPRGKPISRPKARKGRKNKVRSEKEDDDTDMITDDDARDHLWMPPSIDDSIDIGEEKVFARDKKNSNIFWPAYVEYYKEPKNAKEKPLYGVHFLDETEAEIPRDWFFTSDQDEFATCKVHIACLSVFLPILLEVLELMVYLARNVAEFYQRSAERY